MNDFLVTSEAVIRKVFWVEWFHRAPHINFTLRKVNATFDPFSHIYQESLGIIGSVPAIVLIFTLLILLFYLLTRCCDNRPRKPGSITCLKAVCVIMAILTLGAMGVSVWGNNEVHNGLTEAIYSLGTITNMVQSLTNKTKMFDETIQRNLEPELNLFRDTIEKHKIDNTTAQMYIMETLYYMKGNISDVLLINVEDIRTKLNRANLTNIFETLGLGELIRWLGSFGLTGLLMTIVLIVPLGVARHSRCTLITFSVLGLISLIVCWILTSLYFVLVVAISDWCMNPNPFVESQLGRLVSTDVASYYVRCDPTRPSPFTRYLTRAQHAADIVQESLARVTISADATYPQNLIHPSLDRLDAYVRQSQRTLGAIAALLECQSLHQQYLMMLNAVCYQSVSGVVYMLLSAAGSGFLLTVLVWFTSHTWIYLNHKDGRVYHGDNMSVAMMPPSAAPVGGSLGRPLSSGGNRGGTGVGPSTIGGGATLSRGGGVVGSLPAHGHGHGHVALHPMNHNHHYPPGPNQGQYATLSKQCKTLESSDFY